MDTNLAKKLFFCRILDLFILSVGLKLLPKKNIEVHLVGLTDYTGDLNYLNHPHIHLHSLGLSCSLVTGIGSDMSKLSYLKVIPRLRKLIKTINPQIVHAHYATSYGLLGALCGKSPLLLTLWGDDVLVFPKKSLCHKKLLEFNLLKSDYIFSTSQALNSAAVAFTSKPIHIVPFGIDTEKMKPQHRIPTEEIVIGTIKSLEDVYGIDYLLMAFASLSKRLPKVPLRLLIVGGGSKERELKNLALELGIFDSTTFTGKVNHENVVQYHNQLDIYVALSRSESFGVAPLEAQACGKPAVVSKVGGLPEVVKDGVTGFTVPVGDIDAATDALAKLVMDKELRDSMGMKARERADQFFSWNTCVESMLNWYNKVLT